MKVQFFFEKQLSFETTLDEDTFNRLMTTISDKNRSNFFAINVANEDGAQNQVWVNADNIDMISVVRS